jgi:hypothetical protein
LKPKRKYFINALSNSGFVKTVAKASPDAKTPKLADLLTILGRQLHIRALGAAVTECELICGRTIM